MRQIIHTIMPMNQENWNERAVHLSRNEDINKG
jgi:hypothetical protein